MTTTPDLTPAPSPDPPKNEPAPAVPKPPPSAPTPATLGFPKDTPVADMTPEQRAAFEAHKREMNRQRKQEWTDATGGRTPAQMKADLAELERLRHEKLTPSEQAIAEARKQGREEKEREMQPQLVEMAFTAALAHLDEDARSELIDTLDLSKFIKDSGAVDTAKVASVANKIAPADKGPGGRIDYGGGRRTDSPASGAGGGSVAAVMAERRAAREAKSK